MISTPAVAIARDSSKLVFAAFMAEEDLVITSTISLLVTANLFPIVYIMTREDHAYTTIYNAAAQAKVDVFWKLYKRLGDSDAADRQAIDLVTANFPALYNAEVNAGRNPEIVAWETREKIVAMT